MYGCQLRRDQNGRWNIIEADDGEVLGNAELMGHHPDGQTVARGQDRGRAGLAFKNAFSGSSTTFFVGVGAFPNHSRKPVSTGVENFKVTFNPPPGYLEADPF
jgi:hypothetical protein